MAVHKLSLGDFDQIDYNLIAIHTSLEDYKLAFKINQILEILLERNTEQIPFEYNKNLIHFSRYTFIDTIDMITWDLIQNKQKIFLNYLIKQDLNLFQEQENLITTAQINLISDLKKVDYFLKMEHAQQLNTQTVINQLKKIDRITAIYNVNPNEIKSKNNLIF